MEQYEIKTIKDLVLLPQEVYSDAIAQLPLAIGQLRLLLATARNEEEYDQLLNGLPDAIVYRHDGEFSSTATMGNDGFKLSKIKVDE